MFNPLNNPLIIKTVLEKAEEELNETLKFRKKQFQNDNLYLWVEKESQKNIVIISLKNESAESLVRMTANELLEDKDIKDQLKKIPSIVRPFINFNKIIPEMNDKLCQKLGSNKYLKITEGISKANIYFCDAEESKLETTNLYEIFG